MVWFEAIESGGVEFIEMPDKGVVVCKLYGCSDIPMIRISKYMKNVVGSYKAYEKYTINDTYVGVAKCSPEDTFDLEYGRKLALTKAKNKRGVAINRALEKFIKDINHDLAVLSSEGIHQVPDPKEFLR